jgi:hypothetical protein
VSALNIEVRNRLGITVCTFEDPALAFKYAASRSDLGPLHVYAVETIRRERLLTEPPVIPMRGARGLRVGR